MKQTCILILGMHRSGTSAITGVLAQLGVYVGSELMAQNEYNPKGYFENNALYAINEKLLAACGSSWDDVFYTPEKLDALTNSQLLNELKNILKSEFGYSRLFAIKDPRLAYLFPIYEHMLKTLGVDVKIIIPYRNPVEVARSLQKRDGISIERGMLLWTYHALLSERVSRAYPRVFFSFDALVGDPASIIEQIDTALGLDLLTGYQKHATAIREFLEPGLKHHNLSIDNLSAHTPKIIKDILALRDTLGTQECAKILDTLYVDFVSAHRLFLHDEITTQTKALLASKTALQAKTQELQTTRSALQESQNTLHVKDQELQASRSALQESQNALHVKDQELQTTRSALQESQNALHVKDQELQASRSAFQESRHSLYAQEQELQASRLALLESQRILHTKEEELKASRSALQESQNTLHFQTQELLSKNHEIDALQHELTLIYTGKSWRFTRPLRKIKKWLIK